MFLPAIKKLCLQIQVCMFVHRYIDLWLSISVMVIKMGSL